ncbi:hypothetical protein [uncultured Martelella sp.]|uniref:hypothetical protein n=1 Tax=uncultured Martelella sp. TaxID=392331 RepID=UPI0029C64C06|nr:hypothetical protein [uncultured Martelella sp.]
MIALFAFWMIPAVLSVAVVIWFIAAARRAPMSANGYAGLMVRARAALFSLFVMWALYGLFALGAWLVRLIGGW